MNDYVLVADHGPVRWLTLNQPQRKNAVPAGGWDQIAASCDDFARSQQRVVVLRGSGDDFCSGADLDLDELDELRNPVAGREHMQRCARAASALHRLSKPSIAAIDGVAVGAGLSLAIGCDLAVATDRARFSAVFVKRGLTMDLGATWLLPRAVGLPKAREIAMTGRVVEAEEALAIGLVNRVVAATELESVVVTLAAELAAGAPLAQRFVKTGLSQSTDMTFEQALAYESQAQSALLASEDVGEGVAAFVERRTANFIGE